jgi:hypothetical protein
VRQPPIGTAILETRALEPPKPRACRLAVAETVAWVEPPMADIKQS